MDRTDPSAYQPHLGRLSHAWRFLVILAISAVVAPAGLTRLAEHAPALVVLDVAVGLVTFVLVFFRRRWPLPVALTIHALSAVSLAATGPSVLAAFSLATRRLWREISALAVTTLAAGMLNSFLTARAEDAAWTPGDIGLSLLVGLILTSVVFGWGMYVGSRRELVWALRQRAVRAETEQELRARQARGNERSRIAREMHDVLAHRISQVSMRAGALAFREDLDTGTMRHEAAAIQDQANEALTELRAVLGVLRDSETGEVLDRPQPTYRDLVPLVDQFRASGVRVTWDDQVAVPVPDDLGRTAYRIVQEGVTNAAKHAPGATVHVRIAGAPGAGLTLELRNARGFGRSLTPGSGLGLIGLGERAQLRGGRLAPRLDGGDFVLEGWLPWEE